ncbi:nucleotidyl transferase AbiEii/AbiGii toxin family protein [Massilia sp. SM-13]|uniref:nucleotidyl transferase AbiEii/AbiGii toxin family protein n=1 Tax=Pseudoduganella rhizocola TaxID=3382643 RepID=UPI0038B62DED
MIPRSIKPEYPIDPGAIEILRAVAEEAQAEGIDYMLVGATARDILLKHVFGVETRRATYDIDFAVAVKDWQQFNDLRSRLLKRASFKAGGPALQRLYYKGVAGDLDWPLDLVPFGEISQGSNAIAWPPDMKVIMNVAGYDDVLAAAELVAFAPDFTAKVVSLAGLAILKLIAWSDRGRENPKDAEDLHHLMKNYIDAGNMDRAYETGVMDAGDYDADLATIHLLGADIKRLASPATLVILSDILDQNMGRLTIAISKSRRNDENIESLVEADLQLLRKALS